MKNLWRPISELEDKYSTNLLLCAPELVDLDCNVPGIGMGYFQDAAEGPGVWFAAKWSMTNDEWYECACNPTHFIVIEGPAKEENKWDDEPNENHQKCFHCGAYEDECQCDGGLA